MRQIVRAPLAFAGLVVGGVVLAAVLAFLFGLVVMLLWNWLMPALFGLHALTYWQAWGLVLLAHILFKAGPGHRGHERAEDERWRNRFRTYMRRRFREEGPQGAEPQPEGSEA